MNRGAAEVGNVRGLRSRQGKNYVSAGNRRQAPTKASQGEGRKKECHPNRPIAVKLSE